MALLNLGPDHDPQFLALSSDIVSSTITGVGAAIGAKVYLTDTGATKIIQSDLTLADYTVTTSSSGGGGGAVTNAGVFAVQDNGIAITSINSKLPAALGVGGGLKVDGSGTALPVTEVSLDASIVTQGTTAPTKVVVVSGKTNDGTPQYREIPEGAGGKKCNR